MKQDPNWTVKEYLIMEILAARWRLGEKLWTFPIDVKKSLQKLEDKGMIYYKHGIVEDTYMVFITEEGIKEWGLDKPYYMLIERVKES